MQSVKPTTKREYKPFLAWDMIGEKASIGWAHRSECLYDKYDRYPLGETRRTEKGVEWHGFPFYRSLFAALSASDAGYTAVRLEIVGPTLDYAGKCLGKQRTALWAINAAPIIRELSCWMVEEYIATLKAKHAIKRLQECVDMARAAIDPLHPEGQRLLKVNPYQGYRGYCSDPDAPKLTYDNPLIGNLYGDDARRHFLKIYEYVRESDPRGRFAQLGFEVDKRFEDLVLAAKGETARNPDPGQWEAMMWKAVARSKGLTIEQVRPDLADREVVNA